jgi:hypothetical protein
MKISFKIPMADELAKALCAMSDKDAGAAFKAALAYHQAGGEAPVLPAASQLAFTAMRELIDLSRMKSAAGRAGGNAERFSGRKSDGKQNFANGSAASTAASTAGSSVEDSAGSNEGGFDVLAGLESFL